MSVCKNRLLTVFILLAKVKNLAEEMPIKKCGFDIYSITFRDKPNLTHYLFNSNKNNINQNFYTFGHHYITDSLKKKDISSLFS